MEYYITAWLIDLRTEKCDFIKFNEIKIIQSFNSYESVGKEVLGIRHKNLTGKSKVA